MTRETVLITGGAGFIGSHLADAYLRAGYAVRVLDSCDPQVHRAVGGALWRPDYLSPDVELVRGDVRDRDAVARALRGVSILSHHAAAVGVGQSMYEIERYVSVNTLGASTVLDVVVNERVPLRKMIVASSMSVYGEGVYRNTVTGAHVHAELRPASQLERRCWDPLDESGNPMPPIPTPEDTSTKPASVYALTKRDHEDLFLLIGRTYGIPTVALRYFNVFGPRQALTNPYTGAAAIFCSRLLAGQRPVVFEDGGQLRDFVSVHDVADVNLIVSDHQAADDQVFNIGSGSRIAVRELATKLARALRVEQEPDITNTYRVGDVRHCFADTAKAGRLLGWQAREDVDSRSEELVEWVSRQLVEDRADEMKAELQRRGLAR